MSEPTEPSAQPIGASLRDWDARPGSPLRGLLLLPLTGIWAILASLTVALAAATAPGWFRRRGWFLVRWWGRAPLFWHGIRVELSGHAQLERASEESRAAGAGGARLVLFNHVSILDLFLLSAHSPANAVVIYKQEFHRIPGIGHALRALGCIPVDRSDPERSRASMAAAAERLRATGETVMIAPEGTRSRKGGLQRFKMGPFHLALGTGAPLVPLVMRGIPQLMPMGSFLIRSGVIAVDYLAPIASTDWDAEGLRERAAEVREVFLEYLEPVADA